MYINNTPRFLGGRGGWRSQMSLPSLCIPIRIAAHYMIARCYKSHYIHKEIIMKYKNHIVHRYPCSKITFLLSTCIFLIWKTFTQYLIALKPLVLFHQLKILKSDTTLLHLWLYAESLKYAFPGLPDLKI